MLRPDAPAFRLDRWLTLSVAAPLHGGHGVPRVGAIPILMYHSIAEDVDGDVGPYYRTVTRPATFRRQMALLRQLGFQGLTLSQALRLREAGDGPSGPRRPVVITFDDGFQDVISTAFPALQAEGFNATVFLSTAHLGTRFLNGRPCLRCGEVRELARQGVEFGSHTVHHPQLANLPMDAVSRELVVSKRRIEDLIGAEVASFSYPYRFPEEDRRFVRSLGALLNEHGYRAGVTTSIGVSGPRHDSLFQPRLPVNDGDDHALLEAKLAGAYDWLHGAQLASKRLRAWLRTRRPARAAEGAVPAGRGAARRGGPP